MGDDRIRRRRRRKGSLELESHGRKLLNSQEEEYCLWLILVSVITDCYRLSTNSVKLLEESLFRESDARWYHKFQVKKSEKLLGRIKKLK